MTTESTQHPDISSWEVVGFTGSRHGITDAQAGVLRGLLHQVAMFHHGDCVGADEAAHDIARESGCWITGHPCNLHGMRAHCKCDQLMPPKAPLVRNRDIVNVTNVLIACPETKDEVLRSGTWATIRYSIKEKKPLVIVYPDGDISRRTYPYGTRH